MKRRHQAAPPAGTGIEDVVQPVPAKGRGAVSNADSRYLETRRRREYDGWGDNQDTAVPRTTMEVDSARSIVSRNESPDIPFDRSINPYRGCEHGCIYCYARPSHAWLGLSPGLDFETRLFCKPDAARLLERELSARGYTCAPFAIGANTDAYQPAERRMGITREVLEVLSRCRHPAWILTKSSLVERDLDILAPMARQGLVQVLVSVTTLDHHLSRLLEPRAMAPSRRLETLRRLREAGVPAGVLVAPVIPALTDPEMEAVLEACAEAGAGTAGYVALRLPREVGPLFTEWLEHHFPDRAGHVLSLVRQMHGGRDYDSGFGDRMHGRGPLADIIAARFRAACRRLGLQQGRVALDCTSFRPPRAEGPQLDLFDSPGTEG